eukprot:scaffold2268_cov188-Alexandrium_tamarense.AAC.26
MYQEDADEMHVCWSAPLDPSYLEFKRERIRGENKWTVHPTFGGNVHTSASGLSSASETNGCLPGILSEDAKAKPIDEIYRLYDSQSNVDVGLLELLLGKPN